MIEKKSEKREIPENMVLIPEGSFLMGSTRSDIERLLDLDQNVEGAVRQ